MSQSRPQPPRRGRPPLPPGKGKSEPIVFRATPALKAALEQAAHASGRSLASELEFRLAHSLAIDGSSDSAAAFRGRVASEIAEQFRRYLDEYALRDPEPTPPPPLDPLAKRKLEKELKAILEPHTTTRQKRRS
jgi:hypothetical protein